MYTDHESRIKIYDVFLQTSLNLTSFCRLLTKLHESNVFSHVCLFTRGPHVTITHDAMDVTVEATPLYRALVPSLYNVAASPAGDIWWPRLETYSNLFT